MRAADSDLIIIMFGGGGVGCYVLLQAFCKRRTTTIIAAMIVGGACTSRSCALCVSFCGGFAAEVKRLASFSRSLSQI